MGQAFRRASGRLRAASEPKTAVDHRPPPPKVATHKATEISKAAEQDARDAGKCLCCRFKVFRWEISWLCEILLLSLNFFVRKPKTLVGSTAIKVANEVLLRMCSTMLGNW